MIPLTQIERSQWCTRSPKEAAIVSVAALLLAFIVRMALHPWLKDGIPTFTFLLTTFFIAKRYGYRWGIFVTVTGFLTAVYFFVQPYNSFEMPALEDLYRMLFFFSIALVTIFVFEKTNRDQYEAEIHAKKAGERYSELVQMDRRMSGRSAVKN